MPDKFCETKSGERVTGYISIDGIYFRCRDLSTNALPRSFYESLWGFLLALSLILNSSEMLLPAEDFEVLKFHTYIIKSKIHLDSVVWCASGK